MARQINHVVLIGILLISAYVIEGLSIASWVDGFTKDLNRNINRMVQQINNQVTQDMANVEETIRNLPRDAQGNIISNGSITCSNGSIVYSNDIISSVTNIDDTLKTFTAGCLPNGKPYTRAVVEKREGNMLYHNETICDPKCETSAWKLDLAKPGAKPEIITDTKKDEK